MREVEQPRPEDRHRKREGTKKMVGLLLLLVLAAQTRGKGNKQRRM